MFSRKYECVVIFDVQMPDAARETILKEVSDIVAQTGGQVVEVQPYGVRALSIDLKGRTRGDYRIVRFTSGPETLQKLDRMLRMKEEVLRYLVTKIVAVKPRKTKIRKPKPRPAPASAPAPAPVAAEPAQPQGEGEVATNGQSEQSLSNREHHAAA